MFKFMILSLAAYVILSSIVFTSMRWYWKVVLSLLTLVVAAKLRIVTLIGENWFTSPECLPRPVLFAYNGVYIALIIFMLLLICFDMFSVVVLGIPLIRYPAFRKTYRRIREITHVVMLAFALCFAVVALYNAVQPPIVREFTIYSPMVTEKADGLTFTVLSDLHADKLYNVDYLQAVVERTNATQPDAILLLGDLADGTPEQRAEHLEPLKDLRAKYGAFAVSGNHEYYADYAQLKEFLADAGIDLIENSARNTIPGVSLIGVTDPAARFQGLPAPDLDAALKAAAPNATRILLIHRPDMVNEAAQNGILLQLSGHTHGGSIPGIKQLVAWFNNGYVSGMYECDSMRLYVSPGTCIWNGFPARLLNPSEITVFHLSRRVD